jgi:hypothetical protein
METQSITGGEEARRLFAGHAIVELNSGPGPGRQAENAAGKFLPIARQSGASLAAARVLCTDSTSVHALTPAAARPEPGVRSQPDVPRLLQPATWRLQKRLKPRDDVIDGAFRHKVPVCSVGHPLTVAPVAESGIEPLCVRVGQDDLAYLQETDRPDRSSTHDHLEHGVGVRMSRMTARILSNFAPRSWSRTISASSGLAGVCPSQAKTAVRYAPWGVELPILWAPASVCGLSCNRRAGDQSPDDRPMPSRTLDGPVTAQ